MRDSKRDSITEDGVYGNKLSLLFLYQEEKDCSDFLRCLLAVLVVGFRELDNIEYKEVIAVGYYPHFAAFFIRIFQNLVGQLLAVEYIDKPGKLKKANKFILL